VFPAYLAQYFRAVYTAEPDIENFRCLTFNCAQPNIYAFRAGLGDGGFRGIHRVANYVASHWLEGEGDIPLLRIDDWRLPECGLIALDVEGAEFRALLGAQVTIERFKPVLVIEDKGHVTRFGDSSDEMNQWIVSRGYREHEKIGQDRIWVST
jgi:FkbM family methyltransferase